MRNTIVFLVVLCTAFLPLRAQEYFTVEVGTFLDAKMSDFEAIQPYGFVYANRQGGNLYQVMIGGFDTRAAANKVRDQVVAKGYSSAFVQPRFVDEGKLVPVIQFATRSLKKDLEWEKFQQVGNIFSITRGNQIKLVTGIFRSIDEAKAALPNVRSLGFKDAFIKQVNTIYLHRLSNFEMEGAKTALIPLELNETAKKEKEPASYSDIPSSYGNNEERLYPRSPDAGGTSATNLPAPRSVSVSMPALHTREKRRSVLELQKVLKAGGYYSSTLDGYYGNGTARAFEQFKLDNREYQKYILLAEYMNLPDQSSSDSELQNAINNLLTDPEAPSIVERSNHPLGKAYHAYVLFRTLGASNDVNLLMNTAIKESFVGKKFTQKPPFDFTANYAYSNLAQLILHTHYIHSAPGNNLKVPCWLFQQHPAETAQAYANYTAFSSGDFPLEACDQFMSWEEVKALNAMAVDLNADEKFDNKKLAASATLRAKLYLDPDPFSVIETKSLEQWDASLWSGLNSWANRDPLNQRLVTAFKAAYYQSYARFEDYYLDKGFSAMNAKGLALATIRTVVGYHLERFV